MLRIILIFFSLIASGCYMVVVPIIETKQSNDPDLIHVKEAAKKIFTAVNFATKDCPDFELNNFEDRKDWIQLLTTPGTRCRYDHSESPILPPEKDLIYDCQLYEYTKKDDLNICLLLINELRNSCSSKGSHYLDNVDTSQKEPENFVHTAHLIAYIACGHAIKSGDAVFLLSIDQS